MTKHGSFGLISALVIAVISCLNASYGQTDDNQSAVSEWRKLLAKYPPRKGSIELVLAGSFPTKEQEDKGIYFVQGKHISHDQLDNIIVSDMRGNALYRFSPDGQFLNKFGRPGQGPGDLSLPNYFYITNDNTIIVGETGNMRFQFLDSNGSYKSSFKIFRGYLSWITDKKDRIFAIPRLHPEVKNIVEVLSQTGAIMQTFGEPLKFKYETPIYNDANICINDKDDIFVGFKYLPLIHRYSLEGLLRKEIRLPVELFGEYERSNLDNQARIERKERSFYKPIISGLLPSAEGIIFMHNSPRLEFYECNHDGEILRSYWIEISHEYMTDSFSYIQEKEGGIKFYALQLYPESKVDVLIPKKSLEGGH